MDDFKAELEKAKTKQRDAKKREANFRREYDQVFMLWQKNERTFKTLCVKKWDRRDDLRIRVLLRKSVRLHEGVESFLNHLSKTSVVVKECSDYLEQLQTELSRADAVVEEAKEAIWACHKTGKKRPMYSESSPLEAFCEALRKPDAVERVKKQGWNSIFFPLWVDCGRVTCVPEQGTRQQMMCRHLVARYFLHLNKKQLKYEKQRWDPVNFESCEGGSHSRLRRLAAELVGDIDGILEQRRGGRTFLLEQKLREWYL